MYVSVNLYFYKDIDWVYIFSYDIEIITSFFLGHLDHAKKSTNLNFKLRTMSNECINKKYNENNETKSLVTCERNFI